MSGAINKECSLYEYPNEASKRNKYMCPYCKNDVILRKGIIRKHHFAHKSENNTCKYYTKPSTQHMIDDVKSIIQTNFNNNNQILIESKCEYIKKYNTSCLENINKYIKKTDTITCEINFDFIYNEYDNKADIAFIENGNIKYIIECFIEDNDDSGVQFSKAFNRPEPWFKLDVKDFLEKYSKINNDVHDTSEDTSEDTYEDKSEDTSKDTSKDVKTIKINCLRNARYCHKCSELYKIEQEHNRKNRAKLGEHLKRLKDLRNKKNISNVQTVSNVHNTDTEIWTQHISKKYSVPYWYNSETNESRWTKPDEVQTI
jgi:transposase-like protein